VVTNKYWKGHNKRYNAEVDAKNKKLYELQDKRRDYDLILAKYHHDDKEKRITKGEVDRVAKRKVAKNDALPETLRYRDIIVLDSTKPTP